MNPPKYRRIAILGNYVPRQCGIATFTTDLATHIAAQSPEIVVDVFAMNDGTPHAYEAPVKDTIEACSLDEYRRVADVLNRGQYDVLCVQHEFGIYGGECGEYLLGLLRNVKMPIVTTLHTILREPQEKQRRVFEELLQLSERIVVMTRKGAEILREVYDVPSFRIEIVPHGIHGVGPDDGEKLREEMGFGRRPLLLTFGLLSRDKGIHYMIEAMAEIVRRFPEAIYAVVGATHPHVRAGEGEAYREHLERLCRHLGIEKNVVFVNRFVSNEELGGWLGAADVYVTPYLKAEQITSGTLAYAVGAGNAVVSTPYWHAQELLDEGRGVLVPFRNAEALTNAIGGLLADPKLRGEIKKLAFEHGRSMLWTSVGASYLRTFATAKIESAESLRSIAVPSRPPTRIGVTLPVSHDHLVALTDDVGIFQHATYCFPNRSEGYCTDDCARALEWAVLSQRTRPSLTLKRLRDTYFTFVLHAYNRDAKRFRNFMGFDRTWKDAGSDDCQARTFKALASTYASNAGDEMRHVALDLLQNSLPTVMATKSPRAWAIAILGCAALFQSIKDPTIYFCIEQLAIRLQRLYANHHGPDWRWFEPILAYDNARLPQGLLTAGEILGDTSMQHAALESLAWLSEIQTSPEGAFAPIGSNGFFPRGGERAWYAQQAIDVQASVDAYVAAWHVTQDRFWVEEARRAFGWFLGENTEKLPMADVNSGRCFDGLEEGSVNRNCGAESTLAYLMSCLKIEALKSALTPKTTELKEG